ncbi:MAG: hypothetical protein M1831_000242 [Alyxoria varia]|nr:MAG: hypothetical protein M1831_000242 [Alyxoria varia]
MVRHIFLKANPQQDVQSSVPIFLGGTASEPACYLISACLPTYRPLVELIWERVKKHRQPGEHRRWWSGDGVNNDGEENSGASRLKSLVSGWAMRMRAGSSRGSEALSSREGSATHNEAGGVPTTYELERMNQV